MRRPGGYLTRGGPAAGPRSARSARSPPRCSISLARCSWGESINPCTAQLRRASPLSGCAPSRRPRPHLDRHHFVWSSAAAPSSLSGCPPSRRPRPALDAIIRCGVQPRRRRRSLPARPPAGSTGPGSPLSVWSLAAVSFVVLWLRALPLPRPPFLAAWLPVSVPVAPCLEDPLPLLLTPRGAPVGAPYGASPTAAPAAAPAA